MPISKPRNSARSAIRGSKASIGLEKSTFTENASATSGLTFYDLEVGAKLLYPVLTPLRNAIPRVSGKGGIQANWRAITAINTSRPALRRFGRQSRRRACGRDAGLYRDL